MAASQDTDMTCPQKCSYVLTKHLTLEELCQPVKASVRIKYTSLAVSLRYIALGTNTGVVYVFAKETLKYGHLFTAEKEGAIVQVAFSPDDNILAYALSSGHVFIVRMRMDNRSKPEKLRSCAIHQGANITACCWSPSGSQFFIGDDMGKVTLVNIGGKARDILKASSEVIMKLESPVIQLDAFDDRVLASTLIRTYLCNTNRQQFKHIGSKPRDGYYGSCFYHSHVNTTPVIYCGRPGSRMWEVDYEGGQVINTHQFKQLLNMRSIPVIDVSLTDPSYPVKLMDPPGPQTINFHRLLLCNEQFLLTWNDRGLYIFDPTNVEVVLWNDQVKDVLSIQLYRSEIYVLHHNSNLERLDFLSVPKAVMRLFNQTHMEVAAQVILAFQSAISDVSARKHVPKNMVTHLRDVATKEGWLELADNLEMVIGELQTDVRSISQDGGNKKQDSNYERLDSGIYLIRQRSDPAACSTDDIVEGKSVQGEVGSNVHDPHQESITVDTAGSSLSESVPDPIPGAFTNLADALGYVPEIHLEKEASHQNLRKPQCSVQSPSKEMSVYFNKSASEQDEDIFFNEDEFSNRDYEIEIKSDITDEDTAGVVITQEALSKDVFCKDSSPSRLSTESDSGIAGRWMSQESLAISERSLEVSSSTSRRGSSASGSSAEFLTAGLEAVTPKGSFRKKGKKVKSLHVDLDGSLGDFGLGKPTLKDKKLNMPRISRSNSATTYPKRSEIPKVNRERSDTLCETTPCGSVSETDSTPPVLSIHITSDGALPDTLDKSAVEMSDGAGISEDAGLPAHVGSNENLPDMEKTSDDHMPNTTETSAGVDEDSSNCHIQNQIPSSTVAESEEETSDTNRMESTVNDLPTTPAVNGEVESVESLSIPSVESLSTPPKEEPRAEASPKQTSISIERKHVCDSSCVGGCTAQQKSRKRESSTSLENSGNYSFATSSMSSLESSVEVENKDANTTISDDSSSKRTFLAVKDRISKVSTTTMSLIQTLKEKTENFNKKDVSAEENFDVEEDNEVLKYPAVDLSNLQTMTDAARETLSDPEVLYSPSLTKAALNSWCVCLHQTLASLHREIDRLEQETRLSINQDNSPQKATEGASAVAESIEHSVVDESVGDLSASSGSLPEVGNTDPSVPDCPGVNETISTGDSCSVTTMDGSNICENLDTRTVLEHDLKYCDDPFSLDDSLKDHVSLLALLAFQYECHGHLNDYFQFKCCPNAGCDNEECRRSQTMDVTTNNCPQGNRTDSISSGDDGCDNDEALAAFLRLYYHLLADHPNTLQSAILQSRGSKGARWQSLVRCIKDKTLNNFVNHLLNENEVDGAFDLLRSHINGEGANTLGFISSLYELVPYKTLKFLAVEGTAHISPEEVLILVQGSDTASKQFVFYLQSCLENHSGQERLDCMEDICSCPPVLHAWWNSLLSEGTVNSTPKKCKCGYPWPGSHSSVWSQEKVMQELLQQQCHDSTTLDMCYKYGYWNGYLKQLEMRKDKKLWWSLALQLGDEELLLGYPDFMPSTVEEWRQLLTLKEKQTCGLKNYLKHNQDPIGFYCLNCECYNSVALSMHNDEMELNVKEENTRPDTSSVRGGVLYDITWEALAKIMVLAQGPGKTLELLLTLNCPDGALSLEFYDSCVQISCMEHQQRSFVHGMLEKIDTYLWSKRTTALPAQLCPAVGYEKRSQSSDADSSLLKADKLFSQLSNLKIPVETVEDPASHWGLDTNVMRLCQACGNNLFELVSHNQPGVTIFSCGHGYHRWCCLENVCLHCLQHEEECLSDSVHHKS